MISEKALFLMEIYETVSAGVGKENPTEEELFEACIRTKVFNELFEKFGDGLND